MIKKIVLCLLLCTSCYHVGNKIEPTLQPRTADRYIKSLPSPFAPLSEEEKNTPWGQEYLIGSSFAKNVDYYRAISTFLRAKVLIPANLTQRINEIDYQILLCYYISQKYEDVINAFENSPLPQVDASFPAFNELLIIMYDSYREMKETKKATQILEIIEKNDISVKKKLVQYSVIQGADICSLQKLAKSEPVPKALYSNYCTCKKSVATAQILNAILPGSGYLYVGQKRSAFTSFLMNSLFIAASINFFHHHHIAAGIITTSFEMGWYFGGIYGAGQEAKYYNERIYENAATNSLTEEKMFPVLMLHYGF